MLLHIHGKDGYMNGTQCNIVHTMSFLSKHNVTVVPFTTGNAFLIHGLKAGCGVWNELRWMNLTMENVQVHC